MTLAVEDFLKNVLTIYESDYGDFMRKANGCWIELNHQLAPYCNSNPNIQKKLAQLQVDIQFAPTWEIDSAKEKILEDAKYIDELLLGEKQDWESAPPSTV